jgi:hypothetical protein
MGKAWRACLSPIPLSSADAHRTGIPPGGGLEADRKNSWLVSMFECYITINLNFLQRILFARIGAAMLP